MEELKVQTAIQSRYHVFDTSGKLTFSIVFGLCRRSPADQDARPLLLDTKKSALDVPYALEKGMLTIHPQVNLTGLEDDEHDNGRYLTLPSPIGRTESKLDAFTVYRYRIDPKSKLASRLEPDKEYTIRMTAEDLGVQWYGYGTPQELLGDNGEPLKPSETPRLVNSKSTNGKASFRVVSSLPWPPKVETHLQRAEIDENDPSSTYAVVLSLLNTGSDPVTVQTRGFQHYLKSWGPFQPEEEFADFRPRIIDGWERAGVHSLLILDVATGAVVWEKANPTSAPLRNPKADPRPPLEALLTLKPGVPFTKRIDVGSAFNGLPNGKYVIKMKPQGLWWCIGDVEDFKKDREERVPRRLFGATVPPLALETEDAVELRIEHGLVVR
jgi:hypothetical protein